MSVYIIETKANKYVCKCDFFKSMGLSKDPNVNELMKDRVYVLNVGEAIQFTNVKVTLASKDDVVSLSKYRNKLNRLVGHTTNILIEDITNNEVSIKKLNQRISICK